MSNFKKYANYYNLLYKDKDYEKESSYIDNLIKKYKPKGKEILDLGCGTGKHDIFLSRKGYSVHGVDMSERMLASAKQFSENDVCINGSVSFEKGDIRDISIGKNFDIVISLFHVMSYQVTNEDLENAISTAFSHLKNGGIFIFDFWYGPAVLNQRPEVRIKRLEDNNISITRIAEPFMFPNENLVEVNYEVFIRDKKYNKIEVINETHKMRYLFKTEIEMIFKKIGFEELECLEFITKKPINDNTWNVYIVARKK